MRVRLRLDLPAPLVRQAASYMGSCSTLGQQGARPWALKHASSPRIPRQRRAAKRLRSLAAELDLEQHDRGLG